MSLRIAHISDLHFGAHSQRVADALEGDIVNLEPDLVVASGDFTQYGARSEFLLAQRFLDTLGAPVFAVPGNHDVPAWDLVQRFTDPYRRYRRYICSELEPFLRQEGLAVAGLKTSRRARPGFDWSDGAISRVQLRRMAARFADVPTSDFRIVVAHHPLLHPEEGILAQDIVAKSARALEAFAEVGVRMVLSGHFHKSYIRHHPISEPIAAAVTPETTETPMQAPIMVLQTGSAISTRLRGQPNAFNVIEIDGDTVEVRRRFWDDSAWQEGDRLLARL